PAAKIICKPRFGNFHWGTEIDAATWLGERHIKNWAEILRSGHGSCMLAVSPEIKRDISVYQLRQGRKRHEIRTVSCGNAAGDEPAAAGVRSGKRQQSGQGG